MSDVKEEGYKVSGLRFLPTSISGLYFFPSQTSEILAALAAVFEGYNAEEKAAQLKKVLAHSTSAYYPLFLKLYCLACLQRARTTASSSSGSRMPQGRRRFGRST